MFSSFTAQSLDIRRRTLDYFQPVSQFKPMGKASPISALKYHFLMTRPTSLLINKQKKHGIIIFSYFCHISVSDCFGSCHVPRCPLQHRRACAHIIPLVFPTSDAQKASTHLLRLCCFPGPCSGDMRIQTRHFSFLFALKCVILGRYVDTHVTMDVK